MSSIKVLTLNCWGVFTPLACQFRSERIAAIGIELSKAEYDIVLLQEIWTQSDYDKLCSKILPNMPYTHYWHSGMFGTGCCIFSKHPIVDTFLHRFALNGYAHRPQHGDWFGGKGVGMARLIVNGDTVNVYCTHTHAQYNEESDEYEAHRVGQGFEMGQFIKHTSSNCDYVIVGGDFNFQPKDLGFKLIRDNGNLKDAWIDQCEPISGDEMPTCQRPDSPFTSKYVADRHPHGKGLDFLLFRNNAGYDVTCEKCYLTMGKVPNESYHYSDHEGVAAIFKIRKNPTGMSPERRVQDLEQHLSAALPVLQRGTAQVRGRQAWYGAATVLCLTALLLAPSLLAETLPWGVGAVVGVIRFLLSVGAAWSFWSAVVLSNRELNGLISVRKDVNNMLRASPNI